MVRSNFVIVWVMLISLKKATANDIDTLLALEKSVDGAKTYSAMLTAEE